MGGDSGPLQLLSQPIGKVVEPHVPQHQHQHQHRHLQQPQAAAKQYLAQAEDLALPVAESNEAGHHLQTEEELGSLLQGQLSRLRRSWNPDVFVKEELFVDEDECFDDLPKRPRSN